MKQRYIVFLILILLNAATIFAAENQISVRFLQRLNYATPGQEITLQALITNQSRHPDVLVGHLDLPDNWSAIPANDLLIRAGPCQTVMQTIMIKIPECASEDSFTLYYEVFNRDNINKSDRDACRIIIRIPRENSSQNPLDESPTFNDTVKSETIINNDLKVNLNSELHLQTDASPSDVLLTMTSPKVVETNPGDFVFISGIAKNCTKTNQTRKLCLSYPNKWISVPADNLDITIPANDTALQVLAVKVPDDALYGPYKLHIFFQDDEYQRYPIIVNVLPKVSFKVTYDNIPESCPINTPVDIKLTCLNNSNIPLNFNLEAQGNPSCDISYNCLPIAIGPQDQYQITLKVKPNLPLGEDKQFVFIKITNLETNELIYQQTLSLNITSYMGLEDDPYIRIPSHVRTTALGDNGRHVLAIEWAGGGIVDEERERRLDFDFCIPTDSRNVIYGVDQRLYVGVEEPLWALELGDTVYNLTPLTQRFRYGRGAGFDLNEEWWSTGLHYTQNTFNNSYNPRETCAYFEFEPLENMFVGGNYLHKVAQHTPTSNILTLASEIEFPKKIITEAEFGKNFVKDDGKKDTIAFRIENRGKLFKDTWYDIEKIYAGSGFYGYYHHMDVFSAIVDFPINAIMRGNISTTRLRENFDCSCKRETDDLHPRQVQYNANLTYNFFNNTSLTFTGLYLKAKDESYREQYNFKQNWAGFVFSTLHRGFTFNSIISFGHQIDYLTGNSTNFLQTYYFFLGRELFQNLFGTLFYEGGNTNYYDAKPWRTSFGGSLLYRFLPRSYLEIFLQKVKNTPDMYELSQATFKLNHTLKNMHNIEVSAQYFYYKRHFHNDFLFLVSYTIPFGLSVGRRTDIGCLDGYVYDIWRNVPIPNAMVSLGGGRVVTDSRGYFSMPNVPKGEQCFKTEILPKQMITRDAHSQSIDIQGGKDTQIIIPVTPTCSLSGYLTLYDFEDSFEILNSQDDQIREKSLIDQGPLKGIRVTINRDNGKEIFTAITDYEGTFKFPNLRPGTWHLSINTDYLPHYHYLSMNDLFFEISPEENKEIHFKVLPKARKIQRL